MGNAVPIANTLEILGSVVAAGTNPLRTIGSGNTIDIQAQISQAIASTNATNIGLAAFNSTDFSVDANGFVSLLGPAATSAYNVDAHTAPGTDPVVPDGSGVVNITGGQVAAGTIANVIQTNSLAANTYTIQVQRSSAQAVSTVGANGVSHFDSASFSVDSNGFVNLAGSGGFAWSDISGAFSPLRNNGYFITGTATGTLPASPTQGDTVKFFVDHASQVLTIDAPGSQLIRLGTLITSAGGTATSTAQGDSVELTYRTSDTCWCAIAGFSGTWLMA